MKQWFFILFLSIVFVANSSAAMFMPIQMLSTAPVSSEGTKPSVSTVSAMPCHHVTSESSVKNQVTKTDTTPSTPHCNHCMGAGYASTGDGCSSCSCFSVSGVLSVSVESIPLATPSPEYTDNYLADFTSAPRLPLFRPPQTV